MFSFPAVRDQGELWGALSPACLPLQPSIEFLSPSVPFLPPDLITSFQHLITLYSWGGRGPEHRNSLPKIIHQFSGRTGALFPT